MQVLPEFIFIAQVQKKSNSSKPFARRYCHILYHLKKKNNKEKWKNMSRKIIALHIFPLFLTVRDHNSLQVEKHLEDLLYISLLPCLSISPVLIRVEEIFEPSSALSSSTVIILTGFAPILARISLRTLPLT